jgi:hypothetical protein
MSSCICPPSFNDLPAQRAGAVWFQFEVDLWTLSSVLGSRAVFTENPSADGLDLCRPIGSFSLSEIER